ncbi:NAD-dependent epimerase/dehydratase family protein [Micromonospora sp. WMMD961]|uniref:NAD-dependent epimerase/dehydratase family protein n=1 Tax=Micromonospora sp. WMMD961 TaxID=3016100 RepID=UPI0024166BD7|nr:NAD-dependent epimerase/dehydratase family protein [Micromonospora sp. WMMD961]MDG4782444.1 NAD-dependent epimerase/dehydratase family protein [Micromonospora sp. WMMD961]
MQILITGGTGYLGSVLVEHFVAAGHEVVALTRSPQSAAVATQAGARPLLGSLTDTALLETAAAQADAVVHAAAVDYAGGEDAVRAEAAAVEALIRGAGKAGTGKPFIYTSTNLVYGLDPAQSQNEDAELPEPGLVPAKLVGERLVREAEAAGLNGMIIRVSLVYGRGGTMLLNSLIGAATGSGAAIYIGAGDNEWTPVHVDDLARLYLRALERPTAGTYNAAGTQRFTFRELAEAIADLTGTTATSITAEQAESAMGPMAALIQSSARITSHKARDTFGWSTSGPALPDDVRSGSYRAVNP